jgi:hypothetical protein
MPSLVKNPGVNVAKEPNRLHGVIAQRHKKSLLARIPDQQAMH